MFALIKPPAVRGSAGGTFANVVRENAIGNTNIGPRDPGDLAIILAL
jgi:hypothetical protein